MTLWLGIDENMKKSAVNVDVIFTKINNAMNPNVPRFLFFTPLDNFVVWIND